jgi:hypothetical protein
MYFHKLCEHLHSNNKKVRRKRVSLPQSLAPLKNPTKVPFIAIEKRGEVTHSLIQLTNFPKKPKHTKQWIMKS